MDLPPVLPTGYRVEHHESGLAPLILGFRPSYAAARLLLALAATRMQRQGQTGVLVLIDQTELPEHELERRTLRPRPPAGT